MPTGAKPPADILNKLADFFGTSIDFLINGNADQKAQETLKDASLLQRFKEVEQLPEHERNVLLEIMSAYIRDFKNR